MIHNPDAKSALQRGVCHRPIWLAAGFVRLIGAFAGYSIVLAMLAASPAAKADLPRERPPLITENAEKSIEKALKYLASRQSSDGSYRDSGSMGTYPVTMTSLAGLATAASGSTPTEGTYAKNLRKALTFILDSGQKNGLICRTGNDEESRSMFGHGYALLFLAEVMGTEEDPERLDRIRRILQKGVEITARSQSRLGGWLYTPDMDGDEGAVTITQVQGLRSARNAGVAVPKSTIDRAMKYLEKSALPNGGIAYRVGMTDSRPPITAAAVACWFNAGEYANPLALKALKFCKREIGVGQSRQGVWGHYFYAHLYMSQVMYLAGDKEWNRYFPKMREFLLATQEDDGSWNGDSVGSVYGTAIALIILQLPYNNLPIMQR